MQKKASQASGWCVPDGVVVLDAGPDPAAGRRVGVCVRACVRGDAGLACMRVHTLYTIRSVCTTPHVPSHVLHV